MIILPKLRQFGSKLETIPNWKSSYNADNTELCENNPVWKSKLLSKLTKLAEGQEL